MGALVLELAEFLPRNGGERGSVRLTGGLCMREGSHPTLIPLLNYVFASGDAPDLHSARVEFVLNGAAYVWHGDFSLVSEELSNRTSGARFSSRAAIEAHLAEQLQANGHTRAAAFITPPPHIPGREARPSAGTAPSADKLAAELAQYEQALTSALGAHDTATALYADLFPLLEAQEEASRKLIVKVKQLERHYQAETAIGEFRRLESSIQDRITAARQARQVEKQVAELEKEREGIAFIDESLVVRSDAQEKQVETARQAYVQAEKVRKDAQARLSQLRPLRFWIATAVSIPVLVAPMLLPLPYSEYIWTAGAVLFMSMPVAAFSSLRKRSLSAEAESRQTAADNHRRDLELAELSYRQTLMPFAARDTQHLREKAAQQAEWLARFEGATQDLAHLRKVSGTDDTLKIHSAQESAELAELEQRCRELAPYRLSEPDRQNVEAMVQELEGEARVQKEAATEIRLQCEQLAGGWSDLPRLSERVAGLRLKLAEWRRWEEAFQILKRVVDKLPDIPDVPMAGPEVRASALLVRLTAGRWSKLHYDPGTSEFKLFDEQSGLWIHADRGNPAIRSTVDLAYRLCLLEDEQLSIRLPLCISEPFDELPEAMSAACASVLTEVSQRRQVVLLCRMAPAVRWPEGAGLEAR